MRIGIVGAARIGGTAARSWSRAAYDVLISVSRQPDLLAARASQAPRPYPQAPRPMPWPKPTS